MARTGAGAGLDCSLPTPSTFIRSSARQRHERATAAAKGGGGYSEQEPEKKWGEARSTQCPTLWAVGSRPGGWESARVPSHVGVNIIPHQQEGGIFNVTQQGLTSYPLPFWGCSPFHCFWLTLEKSLQKYIPRFSPPFFRVTPSSPRTSLCDFLARRLDGRVHTGPATHLGASGHRGRAIFFLSPPFRGAVETARPSLTAPHDPANEGTIDTRGPSIGS